jgi:predicted DNA-binding ribbon-helix-helix protein
MAQSKTFVRGVRVSRELWERLKRIAEAKGINCNAIIVRLIANYCEKNSQVNVDKAPKV